jgi:regulatory protein
MADLSQEEKLARAAAALARAEGVAAVRETEPPTDGPAFGPSASEPARRGRRRTRGAGGAKSSPPPEDPQSVRADADPKAVARAIVLRQLGMAPRSRAQLEKKLRERGCDDDVARRVLDRMTEVGLVDDEAYAEMLVRSKQASRGLARRALAHELRKHGINEDLAEEALGEVGSAQERAKAEELVAKKLRTMHGLPADVQARRLAGMLARKGYPGDIAWPVVRDAVNDSVERHRD